MERGPTTLADLFATALGVVGPGQPIVPLVLLRLRAGRPEDAAARRELAAALIDEAEVLLDLP